MSPRPPRILIVDDDPAVLDSYQRILAPQAHGGALAAARAALFDTATAGDAFRPELTLVSQGEAAIEAVALATAHGGFTMAFLDMRMPPGIDGLTTVERLWQIDSDLQVVIASAYADVPWEAMAARFGSTDRLIFLKKPFDTVEARQLACALCRKRELLRDARNREIVLEQHVAERTQELIKALRIARDAAASRMQFLANMSHEIRTPLTAILGFAEMLREPGTSEADRAEQLAILERNSQNLLRLVNDVLDLSKLEAKQLLLEAAPMYLPELVAELLQLMRPQAKEKGLELAVELVGPCPEALVTDRLRVRQILLNLLGNAIKFTGSGSVVLRVGAQPLPSGPGLAFAVCDTGIGIPAERLPALFEPFVQADASTSRRFGGTGLGLSISRRLAELLGGTVAVVSEPGRGSTFTLVLPAGERAVGSPLQSLQELAPLATRKPVVGPRPRLQGRILIAEDGADNQRLLSTILTRAGAEVVLVGNGEAAVAAALQSQADGAPFPLILMDMQMPVLDGYTATRQLRAQGWQAPIVALTAHAMEGDRERCLAEGCDGYETKPVRAERLIEVCRRHGLGISDRPSA